MKYLMPLLLAALPASLAQSPGGGSGVPSAAIPKTTAVLVIETVKQGVTAQQVMTIIPDEIQATARLYLDGKIREWYSRGDGKGVVFLLDVKTEGEARELMDSLPLAKAQLMDHQYVPVGPLMPLRALNPAAFQ
ncbi:hypothetical protein [Occallatibacter savannae]|uniref:hypothetical protein n=1 Tax=Occallatibacter savannae TaxID=1002691 RepID=UPI00194DE3B6|nr:hypothetical protein [Occallatibacter savannae]